VTDLQTLLELARSGLAVALVPALGGAREGDGLALRPAAGEGSGATCSRPCAAPARDGRRWPRASSS
jgi:hypothetical protein